MKINQGIPPRLKGRNRSKEYEVAKEAFEKLSINSFTDVETEYPKTLSMAIIRMSKKSNKKFSVGILDKNLYRLWRVK